MLLLFKVNSPYSSQIFSTNLIVPIFDVDFAPLVELVIIVFLLFNGVSATAGPNHWNELLNARFILVVVAGTGK